MEGNTNPKWGSRWQPACMRGGESSLECELSGYRTQGEEAALPQQVSGVLLGPPGSKQGPLANSCWMP